MHLRERLNLREKRWFDINCWSESLQIASTRGPGADDFDRAWSKYSVAHTASLMGLVAYFGEQPTLAPQYGKQSLDATTEFFFGSWRETFVTEDGHPDPKFWKREFQWMDAFEGALFWGSVLGDWELLEKVGAFPEPDSNISTGFKPQDRDLYLALGAFLFHAPEEVTESKLQKAAAGPKKSCKLVVEIIRACVVRDPKSLQKAYDDFLKYYKKSEFPKEDITKKISIEGTLFFHWARKEGLELRVSPEYSDHIVPSDLIARSEPIELRTV
jgi:hypothetical protein